VLAESARVLELAVDRWDPEDSATRSSVLDSATTLLDLVHGYASRPSGAGADDLVRLPRDDEGPVVLHIEDNYSNLKLVERVLEHRPDVRLAEARTGGTGLALAEELVPALILLDLRLPDMPGADVLHLLRASESMRGIPVVVISAEARPAEADRLLAGGADDFLVKPIDIGALLDVVDRMLARARS
jgi:CheY-like chemotaxis protein